MLTCPSFDQQCSQLAPRDGFDYYCSIDSNWSLNGGDDHGRIVADNEHVFTTYGSLQGFSANMNAKNIKVGIYLLPGALQDDQNKTIQARVSSFRRVSADVMTAGQGGTHAS